MHPNLGVGGGLPIRRDHRWAADQDRPNHDEHTRESSAGRALNARRGPFHGSGHGHRAQPHVLCYPPWGGRGITACRNPYFTTYPLPRRPAPAPRPALPAIGTPLRIPFACGATERAALASWTSSIAAGVDPCQPAGTDSRPRVLASPLCAVTLLAVNGAPLTPAVPPIGVSA